jgi:hypothetical protein
MKDKALTPEEFAKKYCNETTYMGKSNTKLILVSNKDGLLSDLNALIEQNYYPKEFVEWLTGQLDFGYVESSRTWFCVDFDREFTTDELYQYWTNNTNKFKQ